MSRSALRQTLALAGGVLLALAPVLTAAPGEIPAGTPNGFTVRRGTNISHWLSQSRRRGEELMNEAVADDPEDWNRLLARAYRVVREREPERTIVIGSNRWQQVETFDQLRVPEGDPNILLSFHL